MKQPNSISPVQNSTKNLIPEVYDLEVDPKKTSRISIEDNFLGKPKVVKLEEVKPLIPQK